MLSSDFQKRTKAILGDEYDALEAALESQPPVSIRINPKKNDITSPLNFQFSTFNFQPKEVPWCKTGLYLPERPSFTFDPLFHAGTYYVQEAASMFIEQIHQHISKSTNQQIVLDLCAAPGGKSTLLAGLMQKEDLLVSNEVIRSRCNILAENIIKWGSPNCIVTNNDPSDFGKLTHFFDVILTDLPCSGEGMFRKDHASRDEWSVANVQLCALRQQRIVKDVWNALKPGGFLIYSTCTFNTEENEENVYTLAEELNADIIPVPIKTEWNISSSLKNDIPVYRFFPHRTTSEGFFVAVLQKKESPVNTIRLKSNNKQTQQKPSVNLAQIKEYLKEPEQFSLENTTSVNAIQTIHKETYNFLSKQLRIISAGIPVGEFKGKDFIPSTALAMSTELRKDAFINIELSFEDAIKYLQKEAIAMPEGTPKGYVLVTYKNTPLGFVKNIGNRANNLYPSEWRIRKAMP